MHIYVNTYSSQSKYAYISMCVHTHTYPHTHTYVYTVFLPEEKGLVGSVLNAVHWLDGDPDWVAAVRSIPRRSFREDDCFFIEAF